MNLSKQDKLIICGTLFSIGLVVAILFRYPEYTWTCPENFYKVYLLKDYRDSSYTYINKCINSSYFMIDDIVIPKSNVQKNHEFLAVLFGLFMMYLSCAVGIIFIYCKREDSV